MSHKQVPTLLLCAALQCSSAFAAEPASPNGTLRACIQGELPQGLHASAIAVTSPKWATHPLALNGSCLSATLPQAVYLVRGGGDGLTGQAPLVHLGADAQVELRLFKKDGSNPELAGKLRAMAKVDQDIRKNLDFKDQKAMQAMADVDKKNEEALRDILKVYGWPSAELVGYEGASNCWILAQHAPYDLMKEYLPAMKAAADRGELLAANVALTIDRVLVREGKKQLYGSQFKHTASGMVADPIEDPEHLDERRAQMGLGPFEEYRKLIVGAN